MRVFLALFAPGGFLHAEEIAPEQAVFAVGTWRANGGFSPMRSGLGAPNGEVFSLVAGGAVACHVVNLENGGFVITSGDDRDNVAIRGFSSSGNFDPEIDSPLKNLLLASATPPSGGVSLSYGSAENAVFSKKDVDLSSLECGSSFEASSAWRKLLAPSVLRAYANGYSSVDDLCVAPFVKAKWNQGSYGGKPLYNYYTPNNYVCGCVATAMAQIMRHHEYPQTAVSRVSKYIRVDGRLKYLSSYGGVYEWDKMPCVPTSTIADGEREAIGKLTYDCGIAVGMEYYSSGSGAVVSDAAGAFTANFKYANAKYITGDYSNDGKTYYDVSHYTNKCRRAIIANLNAGFPVLLGIREDLTNGHAIVGDGYGYIGEDIYCHLNMGWGGYCDLWYQIPDIKNEYSFNVLGTIVYNVFPSAGGEIVSGRVRDEYGNPVAGADVKIVSGSSSQTVKTGSTGVWAAIVDASKAYGVSVEKSGYVAQSKTTETIARSVSYEFPDNAVVGNVYDCDFVLAEVSFAARDVVSFDAGALLGDGTRRLYFGFSSALLEAEVYFSENAAGPYLALPQSSISVSPDGLSATAVLEGENAAASSGFFRVFGR